MAYVFALNNLYYDPEKGWQIYRLIPREMTPPPPGRTETPEPDESLEGTVLERSPEHPMRPGTPERLLSSPEREATTHAAPHPDLWGSDAYATYQREGPELQFGFLGEESRPIRRSSNRRAQNSAASEVVPQATFPTWSYAGFLSDPESEDEGRSRQTATSVPSQSASAPISPTRSASGSLSSTYIFGGLLDRRSSSRSTDRVSDGNDQVIASGRARANSLKTPTGALRQSTLDEYFERLSLAVLQTSSEGPSVSSTADISSTRVGSGGSGNDGTGDGSQFTATGRGRLASAEASPASSSTFLTPSDSFDTSCTKGSDNGATLALRQALSIPENGTTPATSLRFNLEHAATLLSPDDAYTGSLLPTIPGATEYLVDENGSRLSSREAVRRHGETHMARFLDAYRRGLPTAQGRAEIELQFTRLRNLYHFTASPHLILVADWYDQFLTSFDEPSLWNMYPDDAPATSFP
ncbi:hypothetical protein KC320_g7629 [Hortaea werneckii]|nr:hypothetical protein KC320_g7629 [Hortaea werneckii]